MKGRLLKVTVVSAVFAFVAVACSGGGDSTSQSNSPSAGGQALQNGGTLRIGINADVFTGYDPQKEYYQVSFAFFRCCLSRTLLSYNGLDAAHKGTQLFPDLATAMPTVSADQLTWTFTMKQGLKYAPPMQNVEITSQDIVRALEREATPAVAAGYSFYYSVIKGFDDFSSGKAKTISGLATPDKYTLAITLTQPTGYLPFMFSMPATAPIPPNPDNPKALLGVADGHDDDYGHFMVASGPYMWKGSEALDFSLPVKDQKQVAGYQPNKLWEFVRNPSWDPSTDDIRKAYVDAIEVQVSPGADNIVLDKKVQNDELDTVFQNGVSPTVYRTWTSDPTLKDRIFTNPSPGNYYVSMNLGIPPFDDINVRKAVQYAIDRAGIVRLSGGTVAGTVASHFVPDTLLTTSDGTSLLANYHPYPSTNEQGADSPDGLASAQAEMKKSKYDTNQDGKCDASVCNNIITLNATGATAQAIGALVTQNLAAIGINISVKALANPYAKLVDPSTDIPMQISGGWLQDWPDGFTFFFFPIYGPNILDNGNSNFTLIGATPEQLKRYGLPVTNVPSMDPQIKACLPLTGDDAINCWANADKYLMENIASIVPYIVSNVTNVVSSRVLNYTYGAGFDSQMAYDQVALQPGSS
jgi:peptide/nickel transport system substrate-binding protein